MTEGKEEPGSREALVLSIILLVYSHIRRVIKVVRADEMPLSVTRMQSTSTGDKRDLDIGASDYISDGRSNPDRTVTNSGHK